MFLNQVSQEKHEELLLPRVKHWDKIFQTETIYQTNHLQISLLYILQYIFFVLFIVFNSI